MGRTRTEAGIRVARSEDVPAIQRLLKSIPGVWQNDWRANAVSVAVSSGAELALLAVENGSVVGFCCGHDVEFRGYLSEMAVAPDRQRQGIGAAFLQHLETVLRAQGCALLVANIYPPAEGFYRTLGWQEPNAILLRRRV
jgi:GNAT superfamily N-acetyltransferase